MPGLSQYQYAGLSPRPEDAMDPRNPAFASARDLNYSRYNTRQEGPPPGAPPVEVPYSVDRSELAGAQPQNIDQMLQNLDTGAAAPGTFGQTREAMPPQQGQNPWLAWLMKYLQSKQQTQGR